jgi:hypothetical protein
MTLSSWVRQLYWIFGTRRPDRGPTAQHYKTKTLTLIVFSIMNVGGIVFKDLCAMHVSCITVIRHSKLGMGRNYNGLFCFNNTYKEVLLSGGPVLCCSLRSVSYLELPDSSYALTKNTSTTSTSLLGSRWQIRAPTRLSQALKSVEVGFVVATELSNWLCAHRTAPLSWISRPPPSIARECVGGSIRGRQPSQALSDYQRARRRRRISHAAQRVRRGRNWLALEPDSDLRS